MISFSRESRVFNYRVAGVGIDGDQVLLHKAEGERFWTFPGGRVELGESTIEALQREMREELNAEITVVRLLWVVENFFSYAGSDCHELAFYFLMQLPPTFGAQRQEAFRGLEPDVPGLELLFQWFPRQAATLAALPLVPSFLPAALEQLPETIHHVVHVDGSQVPAG